MRAAGLAALLLLAGALAGPRAAAQDTDAQRAALADAFQDRLEALAAGFDGVAGVAVVDLADGRRFGVREGQAFPQGSAIKVAILLELFRRADADPALLRRRVELAADEVVGGSGVLQQLTPGASALAVEDLAVLMITESDNTATNALIRLLGMDAVDALTAELGLDGIRLRRAMIRPDASARGEENVATPAEAAALLARLHGCDLPLAPASCARVRAILEIPKAGAVRAPLPPDVPVAFKPGSVEGVRAVWALVGLPERPYALAVMTTYGGDGDAFVRQTSEAAWGYFSRLARATPYGVRVPLDVLRRERGDSLPRPRPR